MYFQNPVYQTMRKIQAGKKHSKVFERISIQSLEIDESYEINLKWRFREWRCSFENVHDGRMQTHL